MAGKSLQTSHELPFPLITLMNQWKGDIEDRVRGVTLKQPNEYKPLKAITAAMKTTKET